MLITRKQAGDTIIEVLLSMAVMGLVIGVSYATATKAMHTGQYAHEYSQAVELAQAQLEKVRYIASDPAVLAAHNVFTTGSAYYIDDSMNIVAPPTNVNNLFRVELRYSNAASAPDTFTAHVTWDRESGAKALKGQVSIAYRVHRP